MRPHLNFGAQIQNAASFTEHNVPILEDGQSHTVTAVVQLGHGSCSEGRWTELALGQSPQQDDDAGHPAELHGPLLNPVETRWSQILSIRH